MKVFRIFLVLLFTSVNSLSIASTKPRFFTKTSNSDFVEFFPKRIAYRNNLGTAIFEKIYFDHPNKYIFIGKGGKLLVNVLSGKQILSYKGYYDKLNLNIEFLIEKNTLRPLRAWITKSNIYYASDYVTNCSNKQNSIDDIQEVVLAVTKRKEADELSEAISNVLLDKTCPNSERTKIAEALSASLIIQTKEKGFFDCLDNPENFYSGTIPEDAKNDFSKAVNGLTTVIADIDSEKRKALVISCTNEPNNEKKPIRFIEGKSKIEISLEKNKIPESLSGEKITSAFYHELIHFSGIAEDEKVDAIMELCYSKNSSSISNIQKLYKSKNNIALNSRDTEFTPPWAADPKQDMEVISQNIDTSKMSGTEPLPAPTAAEQKAIAVLYQDDAPVEVKTAAARVAANGLGNTFNGIKQFANAVMSTAVPNAIAAQTMTLNDSSSYKATTDTTSTTSKTNNVKSDPRYKVVEEYVVPPGTQMKPGTAIRLSFNASENEKTDKPAAQNLEVLNNKNLNQPRPKETAKAAGRLPSNEGAPIYANVDNSSPEARQPGASQGSHSNSNIQVPRNANSRKSTSSPFEKMTADEMTSFLKNNKVKTVRKKIELYQNEFDQKLKDVNIRVVLGKEKFGPKKPQRTFIQSGDVLMESGPNK